jgi:hypothetical protein
LKSEAAVTASTDTVRVPVVRRTRGLAVGSVRAVIVAAPSVIVTVTFSMPPSLSERTPSLFASTNTDPEMWNPSHGRT